VINTAAAAASAPVLAAEGLAKRFGNTIALDNVDFDVARGEVHALVGENGAGKSTLIKILAGAFPPDAGTVTIGGAGYRSDPLHARLAGVRTIYQDRTLVAALSVAENILLGDLPRRHGMVDWEAVTATARTALADLAPHIDPSALVATLRPADRQLVEIARALVGRAAVLIFDEPTATLSAPECDQLLKLIRRLAANGLAIVYVSHHLDEVHEIADRITVLRDGRRVGTWTTAQLTPAEVVAAMVGETVEVPFGAEEAAAAKAPLLEIRGLERRGFAGTIDIDVGVGEVVGITGAAGTGRTQILEILFGVRKPLRGIVRLAGRELQIRHPADAIAAGVVLVPEDRMQQGLIGTLDVAENVAFAALQERRAPLVDRRAEASLARRFIADLSIRASGPRAAITSLSGGNQQKVVIGKWLAVEARVLLFDEPTAGIDIGAKAEVHALMRKLAAEGKAIVVVSSDLPELEQVADRVIVLRRDGSARHFARPLRHDELLGAVTGVAA
jgi:ABC-type sugar transport system ATPase subunit